MNSLEPSPVASVDDDGDLPFFQVGGAHVFIKRIAFGTGLFGAVHNGDAVCRCRNCRKKIFRGKGTVEANLDQPDALALVGQVVDHLFEGFAGGSHGDDHAVGFGIAHIVEGFVAPAGEAAHLFHAVGNDARRFVVVGIASFNALVVDVRVLGGAAELGALRVGGPGAEFCNGFPVDQLGHVGVIDELDFLDFVGGSKTVEEVQERDARLDGGQVRHQGHVHGFLDRC